MTLFLIEIEKNIIAANAQIELNAGIPCPGTSKWAIPRKAYNQDFWFIPMPAENGWNGISKEQMMQNVINVQQKEYDPAWFPPRPSE